MFCMHAGKGEIGEGGLEDVLCRVISFVDSYIYSCIDDPFIHCFIQNSFTLLGTALLYPEQHYSKQLCPTHGQVTAAQKIVRYTHNSIWR